MQKKNKKSKILYKWIAIKIDNNYFINFIKFLKYIFDKMFSEFFQIFLEIV